MEKIVVHVDSDLEDLIPGYLENRRQDVEAILRAMENKDFEAIRVLGHTMKGTGGSYGFELITDLGRALEKAARDLDEASVKQSAVSLRDYIQAVEVVFQ